MVDNLNSIFNHYSGKEKLEFEIEKLQSHLLELEIDKKRLEKNQLNAKQAIAARQEAEEKLNAANVKIESLLDRLEKGKQDFSDSISFKLTESIPPRNIEPYLTQLASVRSDRQSLITLYAGPNSNIDDIARTPNEDIDQNTRYLLEKLDTGKGFVLFYDTFGMIREAIIPPLPLSSQSFIYEDHFDIKLLEDELKDTKYSLILAAHAGESLIGLTASKEDFEQYQIIKSSVKAKHTKGGFSQRRFERLREEDITHHMEKVRENLDDMLSETPDIEQIFLCGDIQLAENIIKGLDPDIPVIKDNIDARIEKHDPQAIVRNLYSLKRYKL